jgi:hypothetical protein
VKLRRLEAADAPAFQRPRIEGFALQPREFRYAPEDEADMPLAEVAARLERDFVVGVFQGETLVAQNGERASERSIIDRESEADWDIFSVLIIGSPRSRSLLRRLIRFA